MKKNIHPHTKREQGAKSAKVDKVSSRYGVRVYIYSNLLAWGLVLFLIGNYAFGWTTPSLDPPGGNVVLESGATPAGSTGYIQFNDAGNLGADSNLFWDNSNKHLGIGTTAPSTKLEVVGEIKATNPGSATGLLTFSSPSGVPGVIGKVDDAGILQRRDIRFTTTGIALLTADGDVLPGGSNGLIINEAGNVGIGTTSPGAKLDVNAGTGNKVRITTTPSGQTGTYTVNYNALEVCQWGTCCPPWKDCDGDGKTYMAGNDCDEGCATCFSGQTTCCATPDGRDNNCNGYVDEFVHQVNLRLNSQTWNSCTNLCANYNQTCVSVGTDPAATNSGFYYLNNLKCTFGTTGCSGTMSNTGASGTCNGARPDWTRCNCQASFYY